MRPEAPLRVAVLASGRGSTFAALIEAGRAGVMPAEVVLVVASREQAGVVAVAAELGVECVVIDERIVGHAEADRRAVAALTEREVDLVALAGYARKVGPETLAAFSGRMLNTHPAPLLRFGGKGMFGEHVHRAVLDAGVSQSAATVHLVDAEYDTGSVLAERAVPVLPGDDVQTLQARVQVAERELLIETIARFATTAG